MIGIGDWGLGLGIGIRDWDWGFGLGIWIEIWDWGLGIGIGDWLRLLVLTLDCDFWL